MALCGGRDYKNVRKFPHLKGCMELQYVFSCTLVCLIAPVWPISYFLLLEGVDEECIESTYGVIQEKKNTVHTLLGFFLVQLCSPADKASID